MSNIQIPENTQKYSKITVNSNIKSQKNLNDNLKNKI